MITSKKQIFSLLSYLSMAVAISLLIAVMPLWAEESEELAKKLANPVASLISVPIEYDYDSDISPTDSGERWTFPTTFRNDDGSCTAAVTRHYQNVMPPRYQMF